MEKIRLKIYNFNTFSSANLAAKFAIDMGAENVILKPKPRGYSVLFASSWKVDLRTFSLDAPCTKFYRNGIKWVQEEDEFVKDAYLCWYSIDEIANKVRRSPNSISAALNRLQLIERAKSLHDSWDETWNGPPDDITFSDSKGLLDKHKAEFSYWGVISVENAYSGFLNLTKDEIDRVFKILMWFDRWDIAARFSLELGDTQRAFMLARQGGDMLLALRILNSSSDLPELYSAQRNMLNSFFTKKIIYEFPSNLERWVKAAKSREKAYSNKQEERPICLIEDVLYISTKKLPDNLLALIGNGAKLEDLVKNGNKLAACFLADLCTQDFYINWDFNNDRSDEFRLVQNGYWPTKQEIEELLRINLPFDEKIACKLSHTLSSEQDYLDNHSYYKYHLLMDHHIHYPRVIDDPQDEIDHNAPEWVNGGQPVCLYCGRIVDKLWGVCKDCATSGKGDNRRDYDVEDIVSDIYEDKILADYESEVSSELLEEFFTDADAI